MTDPTAKSSELSNANQAIVTLSVDDADNLPDAVRRAIIEIADRLQQQGAKPDNKMQYNERCDPALRSR
ncbi:hypothetical protein [Gloeobacter kilaueensis]|uniref:hypothetical protein n=1 Tax=Gloeobacter kilaueensis TaxID=1416614 RepID=UPI0011842110|nr:hypothetical protein [Gloeobacter kilaueensis]